MTSIQNESLTLTNNSKLHEQILFQPHPISNILLELTHRCDFTCDHCYLDSAGGGNIKIPIIEQLLDCMRQWDTKSIQLTGGDPILHPDFEYIVDLVSDSSLNVSLTCNISRIDQIQPSIIKKIGAVQMSIHPSDINSEYARAALYKRIKNIQYLSPGTKVVLTWTINGNEKGKSKEFLTFCIDGRIPYKVGIARGVGRASNFCQERWTDIALENMNMRSFEKKMADELYGLNINSEQQESYIEDHEKPLHCCHFNTIVVSPEGALYPCVLLRSPSFYIGKIYDREIVYRAPKQLAQFQKYVQIDKLPYCGECAWCQYCALACPALIAASKDVRPCERIGYDPNLLFPYSHKNLDENSLVSDDRVDKAFQLMVWEPNCDWQYNYGPCVGGGGPGCAR